MSRPQNFIATATAIRRQGNEEFHHRHPSPLVFDFHPFSSLPDSSNPSFLDECTSSFDFGSDFVENLCSECEDPKCFYNGGEEDFDQMNFITDLFGSIHDADDTIWEVDSGRSEYSSLDFGLGTSLEENAGLRAGGVDFDSDSEEFVLNSGFVDNEEIFYDGFTLDNAYRNENEREEFEWEELGGRIHFDGRENLSSGIDRIEAIPVSSDVYFSEAGFRNGGENWNFEWEILTTMHELERSFESEEDDEASQGNLPEDYVLTMEYDTFLDTLVENDNAVSGSPPTAKYVVENLPSLVMTKDQLEELDPNVGVACAVCKEEISVGVKVTRLPCNHLYHGECILPWFQIRNTCPLCRFELPTDNAEHERRRSQRGGSEITAQLADVFEIAAHLTDVSEITAHLVDVSEISAQLADLSEEEMYAFELFP